MGLQRSLKSSNIWNGLRRTCSNKKKLFVVFGAIMIVLIVILSITLYFTLKNDDKAHIATTEAPLPGEDMVFGDCYDMKLTSRLGKYKNGAVAVDSETCSTIGKDILVQNGSVVDAAIAAALCDGLFNSQSMGIGGGHFMLVYLRENKTLIGIDARETAPQSSYETMFVNNPELASKGGLALGVPGEIAGYWRAHQLAGRLPWKRLFEPAINFCRNGFRISPATAESLQNFESFIRQDEPLKRLFVNPITNRVYDFNDTIKFPELANTLEIIAEKGANAFYNGELSQAIVDEINSNGGNFSLNDLKSYRVIERKPIEVRLTDKYRACVMPSPSSGVLVTFIINVMKRFNLTDDKISTTEANEALYYHRLLETFKHAFAHRFLLGDANFVDTSQIIKNLTDDAYIDYVHSRIRDDQTFNLSYYGGGLSADDKGTAHLSILGSNGDAVSMTSSINCFFGALFAGNSTGIIYNNQMEDFSMPQQSNQYGLPVSQANYIRPGKRPISSMSPIIILDENDNVRLVLGAAGGRNIVTSVSLAAISSLWLNKNIKEAIDEPRLHSQLIPEEVGIEKGISIEARKILRSKGHKLISMEFGASIIQGVERRQNGELWANSDFRKGGGEADGY